MAFVFVSVLLKCLGELAVILCSGIFARVWGTVLGLLWGNSRCPMGQWFTVAIKCARLYVLSCSFTVHSVQGSLAECRSVLVFFPLPPHPLLLLLLLLLSLYLH